ncbi:MAG: DNA cytosine methyltransferase [Syntrophobacteraceae bacterium]
MVSTMESGCRKRKVAKVRLGCPPRVLDLFGGCGGLSLGFQLEGFNIAGAVEYDPLANLSHATNFHKAKPKQLQEAHETARDIVITAPHQLMAELRLGNKVEECIDVLIGGPPCQAFARVGRAKLREVAAHPEAFLNDPRSNLYLRFLHYIHELQPIAILMENVPDVLNYGGHNIAEEMCETLAEMGYSCKYTLLNSVFYGVPEMRERMFLVAYAPELSTPVSFPEPTHWFELPRGYEGSRRVALKPLDNNNGNGFYVPRSEASPNLPPAVTAREAIGDLPRIVSHLEGKLKRGTRRLDTLVPYPKGATLSSYARLMRRWPGFESPIGVYDHVIRSLPRDYAIFRRMNPGDQYPEAYGHALSLLEEATDELNLKGEQIRRGSKRYLELKKTIVPPYDPFKFPNKWRKMESDCPARTLMAHLGKDSYSHIHYDSAQARTISVREAARLQSFPDGFRFAGTMNPAFRQIGNAVPPLLAAAIAKEMRLQIQGKKRGKKTGSKTTDSLRSNIL